MYLTQVDGGTKISEILLDLKEKEDGENQLMY